MRGKIKKIIERHRQEDKNRQEAKEKVYKAREEAERALKRLEESDVKTILRYLMSLNLLIEIKGKPTTKT